MNSEMVKRFKEVYGSKVEFPEILELDEGKANYTVSVLKVRMEMQGYSTEEMLTKIEDNMEVLTDIDPSDKNFSLKEILLKSGITSDENICFFLDGLRTAKFEDINKYFHGLFLLKDKNIYIFDYTYEWIFCATHYQKVGILKTSGYLKQKDMVEKEKNRMPVFLKLYIGLTAIVVVGSLFLFNKQVEVLPGLFLSGIAGFIYRECILLLSVLFIYGIVNRHDWARRLILYWTIVELPFNYVSAWISLGNQNTKYYKYFYDKIALMGNESSLTIYATLYFYLFFSAIFHFLPTCIIIIYFARKNKYFKR